MKTYCRLGKILAAAGLLAASLFLCGTAGAGEELKRAREAAAPGSEGRAFDIAVEGLKTAPQDKELFLYAVELLPENSTGRAWTLAAISAAMLKKKSEYYAWYLGACKAMRVSGKAREALSNCKKALELEPTVYPVYRELGLTYAAAGNPLKAAETLAQGVEIFPSSYQARYYLAKALEKRGDSGRAAASYAKGLALAERDSSLDAGYYLALIKAGLERTALKKEKARAKIPEPPPTGNKQPEPGDKMARIREEEPKTDTLTSAQMLEELKLRLAVDGKKTALQPEDIKLFKAIKAAETGGAVDYLKKKAPSARGLTAERKTAEGIRLLLTGNGYKTYIFHATREAIKFFEEQGIGLREIFTLRTLAGVPVFDPGGKLTPEGEELWRKSSPGTKTWLLTYEPAPASRQARQADKDIAEAEKSGYKEISEPEYLWLLRATDCPEDVLQKDPVKLRIISDGARGRYMLCYVPAALCMNGVNDKLPPYIESYRAGNDDISEAKTSTAFFGSGGLKKRRFCENGKIWGGEVE